MSGVDASVDSNRELPTYPPNPTAAAPDGNSEAAMLQFHTVVFLSFNCRFPIQIHVREFQIIRNCFNVIYIQKEKKREPAAGGARLGSGSISFRSPHLLQLELINSRGGFV